MATININGVEYDTENLSEEAKNQVVNLQFVQTRISQLNAEIGMVRRQASQQIRGLNGYRSNRS